MAWNFVHKWKTNHQQIFINQNSLVQFNYLQGYKLQKISNTICYLLFFALNCSTIYLFETNLTNSVINRAAQWKTALSYGLVDGIHNLFAGILIWKVFNSLYKDHKNYQTHWFWMIFWVINAILIHGLIYYWHTIITKNSQDLLMLRHLAILLWYFLLIEIAYNCFLIRYNGKVVGTEINLYKIRIITYGFIIFYSLLAYLLTITNPDQIIRNWKTILSTIYHYSFWGIIRCWLLVMALIILPLLTYYLIVNKLPYKRINNQSHVIWATKVSFILLISNALYYLCYLFHKTNKTFHQANWYYLAVVILIVVSLWGGVIWNKLKMDSGIYYFLIVGFSWLFLIWMLVVLFISVDQFQNQHTKLNTSLFALSCVLIFATITFNHYQMNKLQLITFNLSSILIGLLLLLLIFVNSYSEKKPIQFKNGEFNFYLWIYLSMAAIIFCNFNVFLFGFIIAIKRLKRKSHKRKSFWHNKKERNQQYLANIYHGQFQ